MTDIIAVFDGMHAKPSDPEKVGVPLEEIESEKAAD